MLFLTSEKKTNLGGRGLSSVILGGWRRCAHVDCIGSDEKSLIPGSGSNCWPNNWNGSEQIGLEMGGLRGKLAINTLKREGKGSPPEIVHCWGALQEKTRLFSCAPTHFLNNQTKLEHWRRMRTALIGGGGGGWWSETVTANLAPKWFTGKAALYYWQEIQKIPTLDPRLKKLFQFYECENGVFFW